MIYWHASKRHYRDHIRHHLAFTPREALEVDGPKDTPTDATVLVASRGDASVFPNQDVVLIEHGVGQSYLVYQKGEWVRIDAGNRKPNPNVTQHWVSNLNSVQPMDGVLPYATPVQVGSPHLAGLALMRRKHLKRWGYNEVPNVVVACHWNGSVAPEARGAWPWVSNPIADAMRLHPGFTVTLVPHPLLGRGPMSRTRLPDPVRVLMEANWPAVLATADIVVADNTSMLWEAAALDIPTLAVWPPSWRNRKTVPRHGLRFPGDSALDHPYDFEEPADISRTVVEWVDAPPDMSGFGAKVRGRLYPLLDQTATLTSVALAMVDTAT